MDDMDPLTTHYYDQLETFYYLTPKEKFMIPLVFCGSGHRDWPWWMFWQKGHREHEYIGQLESPIGPYTQLMVCPGRRMG